jgi:hypothetical protein
MRNRDHRQSPPGGCFTPIATLALRPPQSSSGLPRPRVMADKQCKQGCNTRTSAIKAPGVKSHTTALLALLHLRQQTDELAMVFSGCAVQKTFNVSLTACYRNVFDGCQIAWRAVQATSAPPAFACCTCGPCPCWTWTHAHDARCIHAQYDSLVYVVCASFCVYWKIRSAGVVTTC